ncbi:MAG: hypothetical protein HYT15_03415 [Candidatus Magasanikbacteria bacterium]|nr:hypothetical protein [Candidatus Magasanikbacteria bacterium]
MTSKKKAAEALASKDRNKKEWHKFNRDWLFSMLWLPPWRLVQEVVKAGIFPALLSHRKRVRELAAKFANEPDDPKLLAEAEREADRAARGVAEPEPDNALNQVLNPQDLPDE